MSQTFATPRVVREFRRDGTIVLRSAEPLAPHEDHLAQMLRRWAAATPEAVLVTDPGGGRVTYAEARRAADALAQAFLDRGLGPDRGVMVLSGNSIAHLLVTLGAYTAGVPVVPASVAYSALSADHHQLRAMAQLVRPGLVFADDGEAFGPALAAVAGSGAQVVTQRGGAAQTLDELAGTTATDDVERAYAAITTDAVAKVLFTSGSTGAPKGVVNTHAMLCANQQMLRQIWPFLADEPPVLVDWLPWSHTFGGNHNLHLVLANGGTLHIDDGKPAPALFSRTLAALRANAPTMYFNVPAGYGALVPALEADRELAAHVLSRLRMLFYAAAALPQALWDRLAALVADVADHPVPMTSSWGTTETAPAVTSAHFGDGRCGCIGVPLPGDTVKLVPDGDKVEIRVAGPNVTPGYLNQPDLTARAFDDEGFYRSGDAVRFVDPADPSRGLMFDGRIAEDFKLSTGTWVSVAAVRGALLSHARVLADAVLAGHDRDEVTALAWLNPAEAAADDPAVRGRLAAALAALNAGAGSSARVTRLLLCTDPPDLDAGEITDKGYINQRAVLDRRADLVARLHADPPGPEVIVADREG